MERARLSKIQSYAITSKVPLALKVSRKEVILLIGFGQTDLQQPGSLSNSRGDVSKRGEYSL
jgi:hypothetical protein